MKIKNLKIRSKTSIDALPNELKLIEIGGIFYKHSSFRSHFIWQDRGKLWVQKVSSFHEAFDKLFPIHVNGSFLEKNRVLLVNLELRPLVMISEALNYFRWGSCWRFCQEYFPNPVRLLVSDLSPASILNWSHCIEVILMYKQNSAVHVECIRIFHFQHVWYVLWSLDDSILFFIQNQQREQRAQIPTQRSCNTVPCRHFFLFFFSSCVFLNFLVFSKKENERK